DDRGADRSQLPIAEPHRLAGRRRRRQAQPAQVAVRLALVVQAGDRLLADVAALGEAHRALVDPGLLGDRRRGPLAAEARAAGPMTETTASSSERSTSSTSRPIL